MGWNSYGGAAFPEELSSIPHEFELLPAMLKRADPPYMCHMLGKW